MAENKTRITKPVTCYGSISRGLYRSFNQQDMMTDFESSEEPAVVTEESDDAVSKDDLKDLIISGVELDTKRQLGQGSYGVVYKAEYKGIACAAKQVPRKDLRVSSQLEHNFLLECRRHSKLDNQNIVKMFGLFYPKSAILPVLVMELMECNLTQHLKKYNNILMYVKLSILHDISRGLCYLHDQYPPIVHQALYSDNILLTKNLTAKIGDFKTVSNQRDLSIMRNKASDDFLPDSFQSHKYETSLNVFSFGCIVCHVITQKWPSIQSPLPDVDQCKRSGPVINHTDLKPNYLIDDWSVDKYQDYIDSFSSYSLKLLVEACLQGKSKNRPDMSQIHKNITSIMTREYVYIRSYCRIYICIS